ncbi:MAG: TIGR01777 family oxidoreductase [Flavobacteriaceae bacterium]|nr:TIGR01777 family oxidoreductase [Flavobacteriaceae bacterium]
MKVLITGATGLIGSALKSHFKRQNIEVNYLTRNQRLIQSDPHAFGWDPNNGIIDGACFKEVQVIVNLAGARVSRPWTKKGKKILIDSRIKSIALLKNTIDKTNNHQIRHVLCASAIGIYKSDREQAQSEFSEPESNTFLSKLVQNWEQKSLGFEQLGIKTTILRFGHIFSNKGGIYPILNYFVFNRFNFLPGPGMQIYSWIHIEDTVRIIDHLIKKKSQGIYNLVAPEFISHKELIQTISKYKKHKTIVINIPSFLIKVLLGERSQLVLKGQRVSSKKIIDNGYLFKYPLIDSCVKILN